MNIVFVQKSAWTAFLEIDWNFKQLSKISKKKMTKKAIARSPETGLPTFPLKETNISADNGRLSSIVLRLANLWRIAKWQRKP